MAFFIVKKAPKEGEKNLRVVLGKGVAKKAVERNLLKRRVKAVMRPFIGKKGSGFVIIVRPGAAKLSYREIEKDIIGQLNNKK